MGKHLISAYLYSGTEMKFGEKVHGEDMIVWESGKEEVIKGKKMHDEWKDAERERGQI